MTAAEKILGKALAGSNLDTAGWSAIQAGLRDRAFFSSQVEDARILHEARRMCAEVADGRLSASEFRRDMRALLSKMGHPEGDGSLKDLYSQKRLDVLLDTNVRQARGYVQHLEATTRGALMAFPAQELVRVQEREHPRDWAERWVRAGGRFYGGRMIALKTDPVWTDISAFGTPWPPFDFNSGMGVEDIDFETAVELGVIAEDAPIQEPEAPAFNKGMDATVDFDEGSAEWKKLDGIFKDQIKFVPAKGPGEKNRVEWRGELIRETLFSGGNFDIKLGEATPRLLDMLNATAGGKSQAQLLAGKPLFVDQTFRDTKRPDGSDHLSHFFPDPKHPENIPLTAGDMELLPSIWRAPDSVRKLTRELFEADLEGLDGSRYVIQVSIREDENMGNPKLWTFYKTTKERKTAPRATSTPTSVAAENRRYVERQATPRRAIQEQLTTPLEKGKAE